MLDDHLFWFCFGMILGAALTGAIAVRILAQMMKALRKSFEEEKPL